MLKYFIFKKMIKNLSVWQGRQRMVFKLNEFIHPTKKKKSYEKVVRTFSGFVRAF